MSQRCNAAAGGRASIRPCRLFQTAANHQLSIWGVAHLSGRLGSARPSGSCSPQSVDIPTAQQRSGTSPNVLCDTKCMDSDIEGAAASAGGMQRCSPRNTLRLRTPARRVHAAVAAEDATFPGGDVKYTSATQRICIQRCPADIGTELSDKMRSAGVCTNNGSPCCSKASLTTQRQRRAETVQRQGYTDLATDMQQQRLVVAVHRSTQGSAWQAAQSHQLRTKTGWG